MTLQDLNIHLDLVKELQTAREDLSNMQSLILGAQQYDGMPHAHNASRKTETIAIAFERQLEEVSRLEKIVSNSEVEVIAFINSISDSRTKLIFRLRFLCALKWEDVATMISGNNSTESVKMQCYRYIHPQQKP